MVSFSVCAINCAVLFTVLRLVFSELEGQQLGMMFQRGVYGNVAVRQAKILMEQKQILFITSRKAKEWKM